MFTFNRLVGQVICYTKYECRGLCLLYLWFDKLLFAVASSEAPSKYEIVVPNHLHPLRQRRDLSTSTQVSRPTFKYLIQSILKNLSWVFWIDLSPTYQPFGSQKCFKNVSLDGGSLLVNFLVFPVNPKTVLEIAKHHDPNFFLSKRKTWITKISS